MDSIINCFSIILSAIIIIIIPIHKPVKTSPVQSGPFKSNGNESNSIGPLSPLSPLSRSTRTLLVLLSIDSLAPLPFCAVQQQ